MTGKICAYQDCAQSIAPWFELCQEHYADKQVGLINQCPSCGQYKDSSYPLCRQCNARGRSAAPESAPSGRRGKYELEENPAWDRNDADAEEFYVYILKLSNSTFYAGQTRGDLRVRLGEHRDGKTKSTAGKDPKLVWFSFVNTRDEAVVLERSLKMVIDRDERQIRNMIMRFRDLVKEVD